MNIMAPKVSCVLAMVGMCLSAAVSAASPLEIEEPGFTLTLPEGFREMSADENSAEAKRLFVLETSDGKRSNAFLTVSRSIDHDHPELWPEGERQDTKIIGRYSERLNNQDVEVLISQIGSNDSATLERSAYLPLTPNAVRLDLKSPAENDAEAAALLRRILQSVAAAKPAPAPEEPVNWRSALICLALAGLVFVVALAKR